jgi:hypothetical protein
MLAEAELSEYLDEIRKEVCSRCVERPPGGPPCGPLGKPCGVEMHLPQLIDAIREVHSVLIAPYLDNTRGKICTTCPFLHSSFCPCPMDELAVLVVEAIEAVDARRAKREKGAKFTAGLPGEPAPDVEAVAQAYREAAGTWSGCDWTTSFGRAGLDLNGWSAAGAEAWAVDTILTQESEDWSAAACWLRGVERAAAEAEAQAALAVAAANAGEWRAAVEHARKAWAFEFTTGRPLRHYPPTWQGLFEAIEAAAAAHAAPPPAGANA